jgi:hypothetical protein
MSALRTKADIGFPSLTDISQCNRHVRFTLKSGHLQCTSSCPLRVISGHKGRRLQCPLRNQVFS